MTEIEKNLEALAEQINVEHRACDDALRSGLRHAVNAGGLLTEAKERVNHGEWGSWLADNFEGSTRTAQAYMKVSREVPNLDAAKAQRVADLSFRGALAELSAPLEEKPAPPEPVEQPVEEPEDPLTSLYELLAADEDEWYDFGRDVPLTNADVAYLVRVIGEEPAVGRVAAVLFFGEDPGGMPRLNPHGVRDPRMAVLIGRVLQECGSYTYHQLFEQVETTDVPLVRNDRAQLEFLLGLSRKGEPDSYTAYLVAMTGARYKLLNSVAQLSYLADLAKNDVPDKELAEMLRSTIRKREPVYSIADKLSATA